MQFWPVVLGALVGAFIFLWLCLGGRHLDCTRWQELLDPDPKKEHLGRPPPIREIKGTPVRNPPPARPQLKLNPEPTNGYYYVLTNKFESHGEKLCRQVLEAHLGCRFISLRAEFLRNPETGRLLELDCVNFALLLAVEYDGYHHRTFPNRFHANRSEFEAQLRRDDFKKRACKAVGVDLINVPDHVPLTTEAIWSYIEERLPPRLKSSQVNSG